MKLAMSRLKKTKLIKEAHRLLDDIESRLRFIVARIKKSADK